MDEENATLPSSSNSLILGGDASPGSHHNPLASLRRAKLSKIGQALGYSCFSLSGAAVKPPTRGPYTPIRRE